MKNQTQSFSLLLWNYLLILKIILVTCFKDPKVALELKMLTESHLWFCKIIPEATCDKLILALLPYKQWKVGTRHYGPITENGILSRVSGSIYKISKFKKANKKLITVWVVISFERPWKPSAHTQKVLIKMFRLLRRHSGRAACLYSTAHKTQLTILQFEDFLPTSLFPNLLPKPIGGFIVPT